ncbi:MAG: glycosyltransferase family 4 protein [bacterium]|nr:glycosyltransferase family 4 protein [bacterium]
MKRLVRARLLVGIVVEGTQPRILVIGDYDSCLTRERARVAVEAGYEGHWYAPAQANYWKLSPEFEIDGFVCHHFEKRWIPKVSAFLEAIAVDRLVSRIRPDIVHVFMAHPRIYNFALARMKPLVVTVMGADILPEQGFRTWRRKMLTRVLLRNATCITSKSAFLDRAINNCAHIDGTIRRVTWGIDPLQFRPRLDVESLRTELKLPANGLVYFSLRTCDPFYRQEHILRAYAEYARSADRPSSLIFCGSPEDSDYVAYLRATAEELQITEQVRFVGFITAEDMPLYLNLATCAIAVPPSDGMPQSLYECLACECYPILGDLPQYYELVTQHQEGHLVPLDSHEGLVAAMRWVAENPQRVREAGKIGRKRILKVADKGIQSELMSDIYSELIEKETK